MLLLGVLAAQAEGAVGAASDYDLLETEILTSASATVQFTSTNTYTGYQHLQIRMTGHSDRATTTDQWVLTFDNDTNYGVSYKGHRLEANGSSIISGSTGTIYVEGLPTDANARTNEYAAYVTDLLDFYNTNKNLTARILGGGAGTDHKIITLVSGLYLNTSTPTSIELRCLSSTWQIGSRFSLYGLRGA